MNISHRLQLGRRAAVALAILMVLAVPVAAQDSPADHPVATAPGKVGDLLRQWWKEKTAAGNTGDYYDNRDGGHSDLDLAPWPQLRRVAYSNEDIKRRQNWAAQTVLLPHVVFGNSSTSAPPTAGGSNPRFYYTSALGMSFLHDQYRKNNLYIYPEHRDHDPGHNGHGPEGEGWGDLYPTNSPYLIISQGSSGSDQPFLRALPSVLAAFRPEVKRRLVDSGMLMPTIQWLLRTTNRHLKNRDEYLTGKAHPTVFDGGMVDELALVEQAHALTLDRLPPLAQIRVVEEQHPRPGIEYFDLATSEKLADTSGVVARVFRGKNQTRRLVVSADNSFDLNDKTLTFKWVVLRGNPAAIQIKPRDEAGSSAEITVAWQPRRPTAPRSALESNRIDIGVFAHNGTHYSPPAFVTFYTLDNESRAYDAEGRLREIGYGHGATHLSVTDWPRFLELVTTKTPAAKLFGLNEARLSALQTIREDLRRLDEKLAKAPEEAKSEARQARAQFLDQATIPDKLSLKRFAADRLTLLANDPRLLVKYAVLWETLLKEPAHARVRQTALERLFGLGMGLGAGDKQKLAPRLGKTWSAFERGQLARYHGALLAEVAFAGAVAMSSGPNYVDLRLAVPKEWRDVYLYDSKGRYLGWTRYAAGADPVEFNPHGMLVLEKDNLGRCVKARPVSYEQASDFGKRFNANLLRHVPLTETVVFEYANDEDFRGVGRVANRSKK
jgi:hypothetical protein